MSDLLKNITGIISPIFRLGGINGVLLKSASGGFSARNKDDNAYVVMRGADPTDNNDFVTKQYYESNPQKVYYLYDNTFRSTTNSSFVQYNRLNITDTLPIGTYRIGFYVLWSLDSQSDDFRLRVQLDDTTNLINPGATDGNQTYFRIEPQDSGGSGNGGTNQRIPFYGVKYVTFATAASHYIDIDYCNDDSGITASIHEAMVELWRVGI